MDPYDPDFDDGIYTVPNPAPAPDPTVIDPVTGQVVNPVWFYPQPKPPTSGNLGTLNSATYMPPITPGTPMTPAKPMYPVLVIEVVVHPGRPDRWYVDALPDTITADAKDVAKWGGIDAKGRLCMQFHNAKDVVYVKHDNAPNTWDRLYGVIEFTLRGDADEGPEDYENKWGKSEYYDVPGKGYVHD